MSQVETKTETPFWEQGNLAPVHEEVTAFDLPWRARSRRN